MKTLKEIVIEISEGVSGKKTEGIPCKISEGFFKRFSKKKKKKNSEKSMINFLNAYLEEVLKKIPGGYLKKNGGMSHE